MPNQQAIDALKESIANAFNSAIPEVDQSLSPETVSAMTEAMNDIREKNTQMSEIIANAINEFVCKSTVKIKLTWGNIRQLLNGKLNPKINMMYNDIHYCTENPALRRELSWGSVINIDENNLNQSIEIIKSNAIS